MVLSNTDNDSAGITVAAPINGATSEAGRQVTFTVVLNSQPEANVIVPLSSGDDTEGTVARPPDLHRQQLERTPAGDRHRGERLPGRRQPALLVVTGAAISTDPSTCAMDAANVALTNTDNDTAGITVTADPS